MDSVSRQAVSPTTQTSWSGGEEPLLEPVATDTMELRLLGEDAELLLAQSAEPDRPASAAVERAARPAGLKIVRLVREELAGLHLRLLFARTLLALVPIHVGGRLRSAVLRMVGFRVGRGTILAGLPTITSGKRLYKNLVIGSGCWINIECIFDLGAQIRIGDNVAIGHRVIVLTGSHEIGPSSRRAHTLFTKPVSIGPGAWLGSRSTILPGVQIGAGAIVAAGSVVHSNVAPNTLVAGAPARFIRDLD